MLFAYYLCTSKAGFYSRSCGNALPALLFAPGSCELRAADAGLCAPALYVNVACAAGDAGEHVAPRTVPQRERFDTHDLRRGFAELKTHSHGATPRALRHARSPQRVRRAQDTFARRHSESASTRTISAEGSPSSSQICTVLQRERFDTHDLRRGFAELKTNSHGATARALRHARSPQRVRRVPDTFARRHSESASTRTISAEGSPSSRHMRTAPQRVAELKTHSHGATARALRHAQSPQRVRRAQDTFARRHSESASTRTISAEGLPSSRQVRTAPQRERFDTHDLRKGFTFALQRLQMSETLRLPRNAQTLFPKMLRLPRIICISAKRAAPTTKNARQSHRIVRWPWNSAATHKSEDRRGATARPQF